MKTFLKSIKKKKTAPETKKFHPWAPTRLNLQMITDTLTLNKAPFSMSPI